MTPPTLPSRKPPPNIESVMGWLVAAPDANINDAAAAFGVSPRWMAQLLSSDMFKARYTAFARERGVEVFLPTNADRLAGATALALERLGAAVATMVDHETLIKASDTLLKAQKGNITINTTGPVAFALNGQAAAIEAARSEMLAGAQSLSPAAPSATSPRDVQPPPAEGYPVMSEPTILDVVDLNG